jgi:hypothetical protein
MRTVMILTLRTAIILMLALTVLAAPEAQAQVPFKGTLQGQETDLLQGNPPTQILVDGGVTGTATQLGRFTVTYKVSVSLPAGTSVGSAELTAANGDVIFTTLVGLGVPTDTPGLNQIVEINTIAGGTGRFAGAQGSFVVQRLVDLTTQPAPTSGSFQGTITK